jgi:hypothetical protein
MKRNNDARRLIGFLNEKPQGAHRNAIMRACCIRSESAFFDILKIARRISDIEILKNGSYRLISILTILTIATM